VKRLIFVAYTFPPVSTGSAPRNLRLADLLTRNGWQLTVITPVHSGGLPLDDSLEDMLPAGIRVLRKGRAAGPSRIGRLLPSAGSRTVGGGRRGLRRFVLEVLLQPDRYVTWLSSAKSAVMTELREHGADLVVTLGPPHSVHLAGRHAKRTSGVPWAAYFGDLWARDSNIDWENTSRVRRRLVPVYEKMVATGADGIVTTTDGSSAYFRDRYGDACPPVFTLWNGVTSAERERLWNEDGPGIPDGEPVITYTGFFMGMQSPESFLRGFALYLRRHPGSGLRFRVVGDLGCYGHLPGELGVENRVDLTGRVPFREVRQWQLSSDLLLLALSSEPGSELKNPSKTVEYLLARRPVLAVAPEGDLTNALDELGTGYSCRPDPEAICSALEQAVNDIRSGVFRILRKPSDLDGRFDMEAGGRELSAFFERISRG